MKKKTKKCASKTVKRKSKTPEALSQTDLKALLTADDDEHNPQRVDASDDDPVMRILRGELVSALGNTDGREMLLGVVRMAKTGIALLIARDTRAPSPMSPVYPRKARRRRNPTSRTSEERPAFPVDARGTDGIVAILRFDLAQLLAADDLRAGAKLHQMAALAMAGLRLLQVRDPTACLLERGIVANLFDEDDDGDGGLVMLNSNPAASPLTETWGANVIRELVAMMPHLLTPRPAPLSIVDLTVAHRYAVETGDTELAARLLCKISRFADDGNTPEKTNAALVPAILER